MTYWAVVQTHSRREQTVATLLEHAGVESYLPRFGNEKRSAPLFPDYLFVMIALERWYAVRWTAGVHRVLMAGDYPARLNDNVIASLRRRESGGFIKLPKKPNALQLGQQVRILRGSFEGHVALYQGMTGQERERVLLDLLGQLVPVDLPAGNLEPLPDCCVATRFPV